MKENRISQTHPFTSHGLSHFAPKFPKEASLMLKQVKGGSTSAPNRKRETNETGDILRPSRNPSKHNKVTICQN